MPYKVFAIIIFLLLTSFINSYSQTKSIQGNTIEQTSTKLKSNLHHDFLNIDSKKSLISPGDIGLRIESDKKSPGLGILLSLAVPGAGHLYAGRMDVGKYFVTAEVMSWLGVIGLNLYGNYLRDDSRSFASVHAGFNKNGKDDNYYSNLTNFNNIYEYNNEKLRNGQYDLIYDVNTYFWSWDDYNNRVTYDSQRKKSERVYNSRIIFATTLVVNRLISAISTLILINKGNLSSSSININSEILYSPDNLIDGLKLNLVKSF